MLLKNILMSVFYFITMEYIKKIYCDGWFELQFDHFISYQRTLLNNECCERTRDLSKPINKQCIKPCRISLDICIDDVSFTVPSAKLCNIVKYRTGILGTDSFKLDVSKDINIPESVEKIRQTLKYSTMSNNRFKIPFLTARFSNAETKVFKFRLRVLHDYTSYSFEPRVSIIEKDLEESFEPFQKWRTLLLESNSGRAAVHFRFKCKDGFNGSSCNSYIDKTEECKAGWVGKSCETPLCKYGCNTRGGSCVAPNHCKCMFGYKGIDCSQCRIASDCVKEHAYCKERFGCLCKYGWLGYKCQISAFICEGNKDCLNGGYCVPPQNMNGPNDHSCWCPKGYSGRRCEIKDPPCASSPCHNGGECIELNSDEFKCNCKPGFSGRTCRHNINDCINVTCGNAGSCIDSINSYECLCASGWEGNNCTEEKNECSPNPCVHSSNCRDMFNDYICSCNDGWTGKNCDRSISDCNGQCRNGGTCIDKYKSFECQCKDGFIGKYCESNIDDCSSSPCLKGVCVDEVNGFKCICPTGYGGKLCDQLIDYCNYEPCKNNGTCNTLFNDFICSCSSLQFTGKTCEVIVNKTDNEQCESLICRHNSTCIRKGKKEICQCQNGFTGANCETDINDCEPSPCLNGGVCVDRIASFKCICPTTYVGNRCEDKRDFCESSPCENGSNCSSLENDYKCDCAGGYEGYNCGIKVDECLDVFCQNGGTCISKLGAYECKCKPTFGGRNCEIGPDFCYSSPCIQGNCTSTRYGYKCICNPGFAGDDCSENIDDCKTMPCGMRGKCIDGINSFTCVCIRGYHGDICQFEDKCAENPCRYEGICHRNYSDFNCQCRKGFFGKRCQGVQDSCYQPMKIPNSDLFTKLIPTGACGEHGRCISTSFKDFYCDCNNGWKGERCQTNIDDCFNNLCQNQATCLDVEAGYKCVCPSGYKGKYCEEKINMCDSNPCQNNARCIAIINDFICACKNGWKGKICAFNESYCQDYPCRNGGRCTDIGNNYRCECLDGFKGTTCAESLGKCYEGLCENGGTCLSFETTYQCQCPPGFVGERCETDVNECASNPCANGGRCINGQDYYQCECRQGFFGFNCQYEIDECLSNPCTVGSTCINEIGKYRCICVDGFTGNNCSVPTTSKHCYINGEYHKHGETWRNECNRCKCNNANVTCTKIWCGEKICHFTNSVENDECHCRPVKVDCINTPCKQWRICGLIDLRSEETFCTPDTPTANLTGHCAKINFKFSVDIIPKGVSVQELCRQFRSLPLLWQYANNSELHLSCATKIIDNDTSEFIIAVHSELPVASDIALELSKETFEQEDNSLQDLREATVAVVVERNVNIAYQYQKPEDPYTVPMIVLASLLGLIIFVIAVWIYRRYESCRKERKEENFFTQQKNDLKSSKPSLKVADTTQGGETSTKKINNTNKQSAGDFLKGNADCFMEDISLEEVFEEMEIDSPKPVNV